MEAESGLSLHGRRFATVIALVSAASLLLQYVTLIRGTLDTVDPAFATVRYLSYFTILSNILVTGVAGGAALGMDGRWSRFFARPCVRGGVALYIGVTGIVYFLILRHLWQPQGAQWWGDTGLHYATPALYLVWWFACVPHGRLGWGDLPRWLLFPLAYLLWSFARGVAVHEYPYPFIDVDAHGMATVLRNSVGIFVLFLAAGAMLVVLDRALKRAAPETPA